MTGRRRAGEEMDDTRSTGGLSGTPGSPGPGGPGTPAGPGGSDGFDGLFTRVFPAVVGILRRVADPVGGDPGCRNAAVDIAVDVFAWARVRHLDDSDRSVARLVSRALDSGLGLLVLPAHLCPLPADIEPADLLDGDVLIPELARSWATLGIPSPELHTALVDVDRRARRVGLASLGAGLVLEDVAALLDLRGDQALDALAEVAERLTVRRRDRRGAVAGAVS